MKLENVIRHAQNKPQFYKKIVNKFIRLYFNSWVDCSTSIGADTQFAYGGIATVIHQDATIGQNCVLGQAITIGGRSSHQTLPAIHDYVYIGAGARILGPVEIHTGAIIGPNSVVITDVAPFSIVAGIPAKPIGTITSKNFKKYFTKNHHDYIRKLLS